MEGALLAGRGRLPVVALRADPLRPRALRADEPETPAGCAAPPFFTVQECGTPEP